MDRDTAIATLKRHEPMLRELGVERLSLFGSMARGDQTDRSDIDLAVRFGATTRARMGVFEFLDVQATIADLLGNPVDLVTEPARKPRLQHNIDRDRVLVF